MIEAVIFDMDGVLIDSEPLWQRTEVEIFSDIGIQLTPEMQLYTKGLRSDEMVQYWLSRFNRDGLDSGKIIKDYENEMTRIFREEVELMDGAREATQFFRNMKLPLALASSSAMHFIDIFLERFEFREYFSVIYSAEKEPFGKPHPGIYIHVADRLGCDPTHCLAIEDSFHGLIAAKAAKMKVMVLPGSADFNDSRFGAADYKLSELKQINKAIFDSLNN